MHAHTSSIVKCTKFNLNEIRYHSYYLFNRFIYLLDESPSVNSNSCHYLDSIMLWREFERTLRFPLENLVGVQIYNSLIFTMCHRVYFPFCNRNRNISGHCLAKEIKRRIVL